MAGTEHNVDGAYALKTPADSVRYYRDWASSYDRDFAAAMGYRSPAVVADAFAALGGKGPVLDVGAGTGLVGEALARAGIAPADGLDNSADMLAVAAEKGVYCRTITADLTHPLPLPDNTYSGCVSAGTFTTGHVGPEAFAELLRVVTPGALFVVTVHNAFYEAAGFAPYFAGLADRIAGFRTEPFEIYGAGAEGDHSGDRGWIVSFCKV
ncbi:MAG: class I SAM-dependent methyltransferase [Albidovulum sp.]|uniref:class I SAM-dependent DNA methyltransferase n=1 Tax=Albidovulum sp. TaxID=1872424 RepID=UPI003CAEDBC0